MLIDHFVIVTKHFSLPRATKIKLQLLYFLIWIYMDSIRNPSLNYVFIMKQK